MTIGKDARVVVTGGSGFIGTNMVAAARSLDAEVVNLDRSPPVNPLHTDVWRCTDLRDAQDVADVLRDAHPTHVVHLGARTDLDGRRLSSYEANTDGTKNVLDAANSLAVPPRLLVASSRMVCKIGYQPRADDDYCPPNAYGASKVETELLTRRSEYRGSWTLIRPTSIWGPWFGTPYRTFFLAVARSRYVHANQVRVLKSFGYVGNTVAQAIALLSADPALTDRRTFYLADYAPIEVYDFATRIARAAGGGHVWTAPLPALRAGALAGDFVQRLGWNKVPLTRFRLDNLLTEMLHDLGPIRAIIPALPIGLDDGITRTVEWLARTGDLDPVPRR